MKRNDDFTEVPICSMFDPSEQFRDLNAYEIQKLVKVVPDLATQDSEALKEEIRRQLNVLVDTYDALQPVKHD